MSSMSGLPDEVLSNILSLVNKDTGNEVLHCMQVCKHWSAVVPRSISNLALTWRSRSLVDFVQMTKFENLSFLKLNQCRAMEDGWQPLFKALGTNFKHLTILHLVRVRPKLETDDMASLFLHCTALREFHVDGCISRGGALRAVHALPLESLEIRLVPEVTVPFLGQLTTLKALNFAKCLLIVPLFSIANLTNLQSLDLSSCSYINGLPSLANLSHLQNLNLPAYHGNIDGLPDMVQLRNLDIYRCVSVPPLARLSKLESLAVTFRPPNRPQSLAHLARLKRLQLRDNAGVLRLGLPISLEELFLSVGERQGPLSLSAALSNLASLTFLEISAESWQLDLTELTRLTTLSKLHFRECPHLVSLPVLEPLAALQELQVFNCTKLSRLAPPPTLHKLVVEDCRRLQTLSQFDLLTALQHLGLMRCESLSELPCLDNLSELTTLHVHCCPRLEVLPSLGRLYGLRELRLQNLRALPAVPALMHLSLLERLDLWDLNSVQALPDLEGLGALQKLKIRGCAALRELPSLSALWSLQVLKLQFLVELLVLPPLSGLTALRELDLCFSAKLRTLPPLCALSPLRSLILHGCESLESVPPLQGLTRLLDLDVGGCTALLTVPSRDGLNPDIEIHH